MDEWGEMVLALPDLATEQVAKPEVGPDLWDPALALPWVKPPHVQLLNRTKDPGSPTSLL